MRPRKPFIKVGLLIIIVWTSLLSAKSVTAKGWRGIHPLQSTKLDVERLLGSPTKAPWPTTYFYDLKDEHVFINFAANSCEEGSIESWKVPANTVTSILIAPKLERHLKDLNIDAKYEKMADEELKTHIFYSSRDIGEIIETNNGIVMSVTYKPAANYDHLLCFRTSEEGMKARGILCILPIKFDEYGSLPVGDENARLDNIALQLKEQPGTWIYIRVRGDSEQSKKMQAGINRTKKYLIDKCGIKPWRILITPDYSSDDLGFEFWLRPLGNVF